jgi:hypothetical protein
MTTQYIEELLIAAQLHIGVVMDCIDLLADANAEDELRVIALRLNQVAFRAMPAVTVRRAANGPRLSISPVMQPPPSGKRASP